MKILCVYYLNHLELRQTITEHLYAFKRYSGESCFYLNALFGAPIFLEWQRFDLIVYHYTFLSLRWAPPRFESVLKRCHRLRNLAACKVAVPQDEYIYSERMVRFFKDFGVDAVFTCLPPSEYEKVYPRERSGLSHYETVLPGYVDDRMMKRLSSIPPADRKWDVGYRARKLPYWIGRQGQFKSEIADRFLEVAPNDLKTDVSCAQDKVLFGEDWYRFLADCRVVLGCDSGSSLHDPDGSIRRRVEAYVGANPTASFEETEAACFPGMDGHLNLSTTSPRHFECCMTKTCQVLLESDYAGILKPDTHYIPVKRDWSNWGEVLKKIEDRDLCETISENAYRDVILSNRHTYSKFVERILSYARERAGVSNTSVFSTWDYVFLACEKLGLVLLWAIDIRFRLLRRVHVLRLWLYRHFPFFQKFSRKR